MTAVPVRPAVSVIPLRDGPAGPEVFVQHRQPTMDFAAGAVVFPGGRCDPGDVAKGAALAVSDAILVDHVHRWRHLPVAQDRQADARTLLATGLRELAEETGLVADPELLLPWDRWVTPEGWPKRFDVSFFVLPVPREHVRQPAHLTTEAVGSEWTAIHSLLDAGEAGDLRLMTPTRVILRELLDLGTVAEVVRRRPVITGVRDDRPSARPRASDPV